MTTRFAMIGCGGFARRYHVPTLLADADVRLAGIFDPYPAPAVAELARRSGARLVDTLDELPEADAAIVTTPHTLHAGHADHALARGWATLVDKPFVMKSADARRLIAAAAAGRLVNAVGFNRRLDAGCLRAREIIRSGGIGAVRHVQTVQLGYERGGWFLDPALGGGGAYTGRGTHMADIVPWLIDSRPTALRSRLRAGPVGRADLGGFIELAFPGIECLMTCIEEGWHMWDEIRIFGDDGMIELRRPLTMPTGWHLAWLSRRGAAREERAAEPNEGLLTTEFLAALRTGSPVSCSFADALLSVRIIEAAFESAAAGAATIALA
ncbi:MAG: Gfo/Idh/MocA family oxidoreductase [Alphaproteobacteria bacterium]|nr:Gfo/Idh/MocA family oxidoreductase [Alphaproteobacteria bacterium]